MGENKLLALLNALQARRYAFVTPTPATHARVLARRSAALDVRDVFGWSLPFVEATLDPELLRLARDADIIEARGALLASRLRVSTLDDLFLLHSTFPTTQNDSVFFGPDSYRFAAFLKAELPKLSPRRLVDIGTGSGVGAIVAARCAPGAEILATDTNPCAVRLARINAAHAGARVEALETSTLDGVNGDIDCIIANPPYIADAAHRAYRDGGDMHGGALSLAWAKAAAARLRCGGAFLLYTGSAIVGGQDALKSALSEALSGFDIRYGELDPDVFGEELERPDYVDVERIAVVGLVAIKR